jgi:hypothetical protein
MVAHFVFTQSLSNDKTGRQPFGIKRSLAIHHKTIETAQDRFAFRR